VIRIDSTDSGQSTKVELAGSGSWQTPPELDDPVRLAVILDVPAGRADGWRFTGRGPRWGRMGGVLRYRAFFSEVVARAQGGGVGPNLQPSSLSTLVGPGARRREIPEKLTEPPT
jgi:hypothetical protein